MKKLISCVIILCMALAGASAIDAKVKSGRGKKNGSTTRVVKPQNQTKKQVTSLPDPARDADNACNEGEEPLNEFLDKWTNDSNFRRQRSQNAKHGFYFDGQEQLMDMGVEGVELYDEILSNFDNKAWADMLKPHHLLTKKGRCREESTFKWLTVEPDFAVYNMEWEMEYGDMGSGGAVVIGFKRVNGKWEATLIGAVG